VWNDKWLPGVLGRLALLSSATSQAAVWRSRHPGNDHFALFLTAYQRPLPHFPRGRGLRLPAGPRIRPGAPPWTPPGAPLWT
jgi:hypothetical protein